jgi:Domain of unknown function (DUF397)
MADNPVWHSSSYVTPTGGRVEVASVEGGIWVRNASDPNGPILKFTPTEWEAFIGGVQDGEFDPA